MCVRHRWGWNGWGRIGGGGGGCLDETGFWEGALSGGACSRNWYEGVVNFDGHYAKGRAEAVLGYDETIFAWCCKQLGGHDAHGRSGCDGFSIGENARLGETCIAASQSVLRLMSGWNMCTLLNAPACSCHRSTRHARWRGPGARCALLLCACVCLCVLSL